MASDHSAPSLPLGHAETSSKDVGYWFGLERTRAFYFFMCPIAYSLFFHAIILWPHSFVYPWAKWQQISDTFAFWLRRASLKRCLLPSHRIFCSEVWLWQRGGERAKACNIFIPLLVKLKTQQQSVQLTYVDHPSPCAPLLLPFLPSLHRVRVCCCCCFACSAKISEKHRSSLIAARARPPEVARKNSSFNSSNRSAQVSLSERGSEGGREGGVCFSIEHRTDGIDCFCEDGKNRSCFSCFLVHLALEQEVASALCPALNPMLLN